MRLARVGPQLVAVHYVLESAAEHYVTNNNFSWHSEASLLRASVAMDSKCI